MITFIENMPLLSILAFVEGVVVFIVGAMVYIRDRKRKSNSYFFLLTLIIGAWILTVGLFEVVPGGTLESFLLLLRFSLGAVIFPLILLFILSLRLHAIRFSFWSKVLIWFPVVAVVVAVLTPDFVIQITATAHGGVKEIIFGPGFVYYIGYIASYIIIGLAMAWRRYLQSAGVYRDQFAHIIMIFSASSVFGVLSQLYFPLIGFYSLEWLGPALATISMVLVGYIMVLYGFWNRKLILTETFVLLGAIVFLFDVFISRSPSELIIKPIILILLIVGSIFLIKNVRKETESKESVEKLTRQLSIVNKELQTLDKRKTDFVATTAFHFRGPVTAVKGYSSLLLEGSLGELSSRARVAVKRIFESSDNLNDIIEDFTNVMHIERGEVSYQFGHMELKELVQDILKEMSVVFKNTGVSVHISSKEHERYNIMGDKGKVRQAISNILDNATKYARNGSIEVSLSRNKKDKTIILSITDSGIGMTPETLKTIFKKFNRGKDASRYYTGGTGLGLYVAREILRMHHADISAESEGRGKGSTFTIVFKQHADKKISKK